MTHRLHTLFLLFLLPATLMAAEPTQLFQDLPLEHGFNLSTVKSTIRPLVLGPIMSNDTDTPPHWRLAQWGTRFNLQTAPAHIAHNGTRTMRNEGKSIEIFPGGLAGEGVQLTVKGGVEYDGKLRQQGEAWPHILVEQRMPKKFMVNDYAKLNFHLEFRVDQCENATDLELIRNRHSAQITAFFAVRNVNKDSKDFRDMIWFGLPLFDARVDIPTGHQAVDGGKDDATGKFICTLDGHRFYEGDTGDGTWKTLDCDLVPLLREALVVSQAKGFLTDTKFEDLHPSSFNLGWEVTGPYDCAITLKGLSLMGEPNQL
jgi:hypothetical protein